jgi:hypothetical protein
MLPLVHFEPVRLAVVARLVEVGRIAVKQCLATIVQSNHIVLDPLCIANLANHRSPRLYCWLIQPDTDWLIQPDTDAQRHQRDPCFGLVAADRPR